MVPDEIQKVFPTSGGNHTVIQTRLQNHPPTANMVNEHPSIFFLKIGHESIIPVQKPEPGFGQIDEWAPGGKEPGEQFQILPFFQIRTKDEWLCLQP